MATAHEHAPAGEGASTAVSACLIVRNSATRIEACLASVRPHVEEVCVYDTGSTDATLTILARLAATPGAPIVVSRGPWHDDFARAREHSFALASHPWRMYLDDDDLLVGGENLSSVVAAAAASGQTAISVAYDHHDQPDGRRVWLWTNRILRRGSGRWEGVVHEHWRGLRVEDIALAHPGSLHVRHRRRAERRGHYQRLIELAAADPARTPRGLMMLGFELLRVDDLRAIRSLEAYLAGGHDRIEGEPNGYRFVVLDQLSQAYARTGQTAQAAAAAAGRDAYGDELARAHATGQIEDVEFWRRLLADTETLVATDGAPPLLPGPASAMRSPAGR